MNKDSIPKEQWEEAMAPVLQFDMSQAQVTIHRPDGSVAVDNIPTPPATTPSLLSDLWACLLLPLRILRRAIAEMAQISRGLGDRP